MKEKRISVRIADELLSVGVRVSSDGGNSWMAITVRDISDSGMGFTVEKDIPVGTKFTLEGSVSDYMKHIDIGCEMVIVFAGKTPEGGNLYGGKFLDMDHTQQTALSIFIEMIVTKFPPLLQQ